MGAAAEEAAEAAGLVPLTAARAAELLPAEAVAQLQADGAACVRGALGPAWVEALRAAAEANMADPGPLCDEHADAAGKAGRFHDDQFLYLRHEAFRHFVFGSGVARLAARAMGSSAAHIFYDQLLVKEPGTDAPTPWHNDTSYWHLNGDHICSTWVALDTVKREQGVQYVRGSHRLPLLHAVTNFSGGDNSDKNTYNDRADLPPVPDVDEEVAAGRMELLGWDMEPGDVLIFFSASLHGAKGNLGSAGRRRGYAVRWLGDDVTFEDRPGTMNEGWVAAGYDNGLAPGAKIACALHPDVLAQ